MARQQASVMSFADVFLILTVLFVVLALFGIIMRRPEPLRQARTDTDRRYHERNIPCRHWHCSD